MAIASAEQVEANGEPSPACPPYSLTYTRIHEIQFRLPGEVDIGCFEDSR